MGARKKSLKWWHFRRDYGYNIEKSTNVIIGEYIRLRPFSHHLRDLLQSPVISYIPYWHKYPRKSRLISQVFGKHQSLENHDLFEDRCYLGARISQNQSIWWICSRRLCRKDSVFGLSWLVILISPKDSQDSGIFIQIPINRFPSKTQL